MNQKKKKNEEKKKKCSYFPSAYTILIVLEFVFFILTYIIPKKNLIQSNMMQILENLY